MSVPNINLLDYLPNTIIIYDVLPNTSKYKINGLYNSSILMKNYLLEGIKINVLSKNNPDKFGLYAIVMDAISRNYYLSLSQYISTKTISQWPTVPGLNTDLTTIDGLPLIVRMGEEVLNRHPILYTDDKFHTDEPEYNNLQAFIYDLIRNMEYNLIDMDFDINNYTMLDIKYIFNK